MVRPQRVTTPLLNPGNTARDWAGAMAWNGYDNQVARITENVLRRFLDPAPL